MKILLLFAVIIGLVIGLTSYLVFDIPVVYSAVLAIGGALMFFFIILWSSYVFIFR